MILTSDGWTRESLIVLLDEIPYVFLLLLMRYSYYTELLKVTTHISVTWEAQWEDHFKKYY